MSETRTYKVISPEGKSQVFSIHIPDNLEEILSPKKEKRKFLNGLRAVLRVLAWPLAALYAILFKRNRIREAEKIPTVEPVKKEPVKGKSAHLIFNTAYWCYLKDSRPVDPRWPVKGAYLIISEIAGVEANLSRCVLQKEVDNQWIDLFSWELEKAINIPAGATKMKIMVSLEKLEGQFEQHSNLRLTCYGKDENENDVSIHVTMSKEARDEHSMRYGMRELAKRKKELEECRLKGLSEKKVHKKQSNRPAIITIITAVLLCTFGLGIYLLVHRSAVNSEAEHDSKAEQALILCQQAINQGSFGKAINYCDEMLATHPDNALAWNNKGVALYAMGQNSEVIACFDNALAQRPNDPVFITNKKKVEDAMRRLQTQQKNEAPVIPEKEKEKTVKEPEVEKPKAIVEEKPIEKPKEAAIPEKKAELFIAGTDWQNLKNPAAGVKIIVSELTGASVSLDKMSCNFWNYNYDKKPDIPSDKNLSITLNPQIIIPALAVNYPININFPVSWVDLFTIYDGFTVTLDGEDENKNPVRLGQYFYQWERKDELKKQEDEKKEKEKQVEKKTEQKVEPAPKKPETPSPKPVEKKKETVIENPSKSKDAESILDAPKAKITVFQPPEPPEPPEFDKEMNKVLEEKLRDTQ